MHVQKINMSIAEQLSSQPKNSKDMACRMPNLNESMGATWLLWHDPWNSTQNPIWLMLDAQSKPNFGELLDRSGMTPIRCNELEKWELLGRSNTTPLDVLNWKIPRKGSCWVLKPVEAWKA